ncbi:MAG: ROK family protein, partial [Clostridiales bacterium]|nr:ROK family protein [Clostridiales bacterium]
YVTDPFKKNTFPPCRDTEFALAKLGNDAGIYGAAKMVL